MTGSHTTRAWLASVALAGAVALLGLLPAAAGAKAGDIIVVDGSAPTNDGAVFRVDPGTGARTVIAQGPPFDDPVWVAFEHDGQLLVSDEDAGGVGSLFRVNPATGARTTVVAGAPLVDPHGIAVGPNRQIYLADEESDLLPATDSGSIFRVDPRTGALTRIATGPPLVDPVGIALAPGFDRAYVVDDGAGSPGGLYSVDLVTGAVTPMFTGPPLHHSAGVAVALAGGIYVVEQGPSLTPDGGLFRFDPAITTIVAPGQFEDPFGIAFAPDGKLYIADESSGPMDNGDLYRVDPKSGAFTAVASGPPFAQPSGVAVEPPRCRGKLATIVGSTAKDRLTGSRFADVMVGLAGRDRINGGKGKDLICGGKGKDRIAGGADPDRLFGEGGNDSLNGGKGKDRCAGGNGADSGSCDKGKL